MYYTGCWNSCIWNNIKRSHTNKRHPAFGARQPGTVSANSSEEYSPEEDARTRGPRGTNGVLCSQKSLYFWPNLTFIKEMSHSFCNYLKTIVCLGTFTLANTKTASLSDGLSLVYTYRRTFHLFDVLCKPHNNTALNIFLNSTKTMTLTLGVNEASLGACFWRQVYLFAGNNFITIEY